MCRGGWMGMLSIVFSKYSCENGGEKEGIHYIFWSYFSSWNSSETQIIGLRIIVLTVNLVFQ